MQKRYEIYRVIHLIYKIYLQIRQYKIGVII